MRRLAYISFCVYVLFIIGLYQVNGSQLNPRFATMSGPSIDNDDFFFDLPPLPAGWDWKRCKAVQPAGPELAALPDAQQSLIRAYTEARRAQWNDMRGADEVAASRRFGLDVRRMGYRAKMQAKAVAAAQQTAAPTRAPALAAVGRRARWFSHSRRDSHVRRARCRPTLWSAARADRHALVRDRRGHASQQVQVLGVHGVPGVGVRIRGGAGPVARVLPAGRRYAQRQVQYPGRTRG